MYKMVDFLAADFHQLFSWVGDARDVVAHHGVAEVREGRI